MAQLLVVHLFDSWGVFAVLTKIDMVWCQHNRKNVTIRDGALIAV